MQYQKTQLEDLSINSHPPVEFTKKLQQLHDKIDSIYTILETLSNRLNKLEYHGEITYGEPFNVGRSNKHVTVSLRREQKESSAPNPHGDDDYATPEDTDLFPGP